VSVRVECTHCGTPCQVPEAHLGKPVRCYKCKEIFTAVPPEPEPEVLLPDFDPPPAPAACRLEVGAASSPGKVRERNEDSFLVQQLAWTSRDVAHEAALLVVADGMGGHQAGDRASRLTVRTVASHLAPLFAEGLADDTGGPDARAWAAAVEQAIKEANRAVLDQAASDLGCKGMGATAAVVLVRGGQALVGHVGDCRVYHQRGGKLVQVTRDQTLVARLVELGQLPPEQALTHPARNEVTQAVGRRADIEPAHYEVELRSGDWLVVACDGLHAHVDAEELEEALAEPGRSARQLARHLVDLADQLGGSDNCTVVAVWCY